MSKQKQKYILYTFVAALFIAAMDTGIISPTRGEIGLHFGVDLPTSIWIMSIYSLGFSTSLLFMTFLSQKFGMKKVIFSAVTMFTISSIFCGISPNFVTFIALRFTQGFFAGGIFPIATSYIGSEFNHDYKGYAMGVLGGTFALGNVMGPALGSIILNFVGNGNWAYLFYINIFFGTLAMFLIWKNVDEVILNKDLKFEFFSILFASLFVLSIMLFFTFLDVSNFITSITSFKVLLTLCMMIVSLLLSTLLTVYLKGPLLVIKDLFRNSIMIKTILSALFASFSIFAIVLYLPQMSENILHLPTGQGGYLATIVGISGTLMGPISGKWLSKLGAFKLYVYFTITLTIALIFMYLALVTTSVVFFVISLILIGCSQNTVVIISSNYFVQTSFSKKLQASAQSILILFRSNYWAIVPSFAIIILKPFTSQAQSYLQQIQTKLNAHSLDYNVCLKHLSHVNNLCEKYTQSFTNGYKTLTLICIGVSLITIISTLWFRKIK